VALAVLLVVFALLWFLVWTKKALLGWPTLSRRGAFLVGYLLFEAVLVAMTELSSIGHHFTRQFVLGGWLFVALCLLGLSWRALGAYLTAASRSRGAIQPVRWVSQALRTEETFWLLIPAFYFGVFVYLIAEHKGMTERTIKAQQDAQSQMDQYVKSVAGKADPAEQIAKAKQLLDAGTISQTEFDQIKQKALAAS